MPKSKESIQQVRSSLLKTLHNGEFHSGQDLATNLGLSRSAISNHIKALRDLGLDIYSVKRRGYKLANPLELLSYEHIKDYLIKSNRERAPLILVENLVSSTNDIVKGHAKNAESGFCCLAEAQSAGRGRRGRTWVSPYASSLYFSMLWRFPSGYQAMAGLSLMVGLIVNDTLSGLGVRSCQLKWPNDIYSDNQKLAGILIEVEGQIGAGASAIIGIGVNMHLPQNLQGIDQAFTDLHSVSGRSIGRNEFAAALIQNLWQALPVFEAEGMKPFMARWHAVDLYFDKKVRLVSGQNEVVGISRGIDETGALLLDINGKVEAFHGGEISVRPA